jgi:uncharacterized OB-fold protein
MSPTKIPGELSVSFRYTPGVGNTAFFEALRDRGVFLGSRCDVCGVTYVPRASSASAASPSSTRARSADRRAS